MLPFVLRREKREVLADLPPKIITEIVCDLTPEPRRLHKTWERGGKNVSTHRKHQDRVDQIATSWSIYFRANILLIAGREPYNLHGPLLSWIGYVLKKILRNIS